MEFDMRALGRTSRYKIIGNCVVPRPIAWITSRSKAGILNCAPFSFFNALGDSPPTIVVGMVAHPETRLKDTPSNIRETGEFVVHLVDETHASAMNITSVEAPPEIDEIALAGLTLVQSASIVTPRIATAPVAFECRMLHYIETGEHQVAIIAEVLFAHIRDEFLLDRERLHIDVTAMRLIARVDGAGWYSRQSDLFQLVRPTWADLQARPESQRPPEPSG